MPVGNKKSTLQDSVPSWSEIAADFGLIAPVHNPATHLPWRIRRQEVQKHLAAVCSEPGRFVHLPSACSRCRSSSSISSRSRCYTDPRVSLLRPLKRSRVTPNFTPSRTTVWRSTLTYCLDCGRTWLKPRSNGNGCPLRFPNLPQEVG